MRPVQSDKERVLRDHDVERGPDCFAAGGVQRSAIDISVDPVLGVRETVVNARIPLQTVVNG